MKSAEINGIRLSYNNKFVIRLRNKRKKRNLMTQKYLNTNKSIIG